MPQAGTLLQLAMHGKVQTVTGYQHLNSRNLSILFLKQLKGEAKSAPEFVKSMKDLNGRFGSVSHDLKVRYIFSIKGPLNILLPVYISNAFEI